MFPTVRPTVHKAFQVTTERLGQAGVTTARLDARLLVTAALEGEDAASEPVLTRPERTLNDAESGRLETLLRRREGFEPMSQILGHREFWSLPFRVSRDVLTPRPDSETLIEAALGWVDKHHSRAAPLRILDLGAGSGCLLLSLLSELPDATGLGVDTSPPALRIANANACALGFGNRARFVESDWCEKVDGPFDLIVSNPPYIPASDLAGLDQEVRDFEPRLALDGGDDGLACYRRLVPQVCGLLATPGGLFLEFGQGQASDISGILAENGFQDIEIKEDLSGEPRVAVAAL